MDDRTTSEPVPDGATAAVVRDLTERLRHVTELLDEQVGRALEDVSLRRFESDASGNLGA